MKRKTINRAEWSGIKKRTYTEKTVSAFGVTGMAGLIVMDEAEDFSVPSPSGELLITRAGYSWLSLAPENSNVWATVMFDENGNLFECYFDMTDGNHILPDGGSWFHDLYLDVVYSPASGTVTVLDEDELREAAGRGEITRDMCEDALKTAEKLSSFLAKNKARFLNECRQLRGRLLAEIS